MTVQVLLPPFSCENSDLCLFGSVCSESKTECICPEGFEHDNLMFHSPNCGVPSIFFPVYMGLYAVFWFAGLVYLLVRIRNLKNNLRSFGALLIVFHFSNLAFIISLIAERGMFRASGFTFCCVCFMIVYLLQYFIVMTIRISRALSKARLASLVFRFRILLFISTCALVTYIGLYLFFDTNPARHDALVVACFCTLIPVWALLAGFSVKYIHELLELLKKSHDHHVSFLRASRIPEPMRDKKTSIAGGDGSFNNSNNELRSMPSATLSFETGKPITSQQSQLKARFEATNKIWTFSMCVILVFSLSVILVRVIHGSFPGAGLVLLLAAPGLSALTFGGFRLFPNLLRDDSSQNAAKSSALMISDLRDIKEKSSKGNSVSEVS